MTAKDIENEALEIQVCQLAKPAVGKISKTSLSSEPDRETEYIEELPFGGTLKYKAIFKKKQVGNDDGPVGLGPKFLDHLDNLVLTIILQKISNLPQGMEAPLIRVTCNDKSSDFLFEESEDGQGGIWNKVLYFPLKGMTVNDFFKEKLIITAFHNQNSTKIDRQYTQSIGDFDYDVFGDFITHNSIDSFNIRSSVIFSVILEKKVNFIDIDEVKYPYNFEKKELESLILQLDDYMNKKGYIKDKKTLLKTYKAVFGGKELIDSIIDVSSGGKFVQFHNLSRNDVCTFLRVLMEIGLIVNPADPKVLITENSKDVFKWVESPTTGSREVFLKFITLFIDKRDRIFKTKIEVFSAPVAKKQTVQPTKGPILNIVRAKKKFGRKELRTLLSKSRQTTRDSLRIDDVPKRRSVSIDLESSTHPSVSVTSSFTRRPTLERIDDSSGSLSSVRRKSSHLGSEMNDMSLGADFGVIDVDELSTELPSKADEIGSLKSSQTLESLPSSINLQESGTPTTLNLSSDVNESVYNLIMKKDEEGAIKLMDGIDVKWRHPSDQKSLLHAAVISNQVKLVDLLISKGFDLNDGDKTQRTPLLFAAGMGNRELTILLLGHGAKIGQKDYYGHTPLFLALKQHKFDIVPDLLLFGGDINAKKDNGMTCLHEAAATGDIEMLDYIFTIKGVKLNLKDNNGKTPLLKAIEKSPFTLIGKLLNKEGVEVGISDEMGRNMLHYIARYNRIELLDLIFQYDENQLSKFSKLISQPDGKKGRTPLMLAVEVGQADLVKDFIKLCDKLKANYHSKDSNGLTAYDMAFLKIEKDLERMMVKESLPEKALELIDRDLIIIEDMLAKKN